MRQIVYLMHSLAQVSWVNSKIKIVGCFMFLTNFEEANCLYLFAGSSLNASKTPTGTARV